MTRIREIEAQLNALIASEVANVEAAALLEMGELILIAWLKAHQKVPTDETREGFRLLALQRQGAIGDPSFNACRETCRELVYHYNLIQQRENEGLECGELYRMMVLITNHLCLFVGGKMEVRAIGEFCCSSALLHRQANDVAEIDNA